MMKTYCDICGVEITETALKGALMRLRRIFPMIPMGPKGEIIAQQRVGEELRDLCEICQMWIFDLCDKKKEELSKKK